MNDEILDLECQVRFIEAAAAHSPTDEVVDLYIDGFWDGVRAAANPRSREQLERVLEFHRARAIGLIK